MSNPNSSLLDGGPGGGPGGAPGGDDPWALGTDPFAPLDAGAAAFSSASATAGKSGNGGGSGGGTSYGSGGGAGAKTSSGAAGKKGNTSTAATSSSSSSSSSTSAGRKTGGGGAGPDAANPFLLGGGAAVGAGAVAASAPSFIMPTDPERLKSELSAAREQAFRLQQDLAEKELEFEKKERLYRTAIEKLEYPTKKNWPRCYPIIHHDIKDDMLTSQRVSLVRGLYAVWLATCVMLIWTFIAICALWFSGVAGHVIKSYWISFLIGVLNVMLGIPMSFVLWYNAAYSKFKQEKITSAMWVFFFNLGIHILWCLYQVLGFSHGTAGIIVAIDVNNYANNTTPENLICPDCCDSHGLCGTAKGIFFMFIASMLGWALVLFATCFSFYKFYRYYRANASSNPLDAPTIVPVLLGLGV